MVCFPPVSNIPIMWVVMVSDVSVMSLVEVVVSSEFFMATVAIPVSVGMVNLASVVTIPVGVVTILVSVVEVVVSFKVMMCVLVSVVVVSVMTFPSVMGIFSSESNTMLFVFVQITMVDGSVEIAVRLSVVSNFPGRSMERHIVCMLTLW